MRGLTPGMTVKVKGKSDLCELVCFDKVNREWCLKKANSKKWVFMGYAKPKDIKKADGKKA